MIICLNYVTLATHMRNFKLLPINKKSIHIKIIVFIIVYMLIKKKFISAIRILATAIRLTAAQKRKKKTELPIKNALCWF